jgi:hypothetical protein
MNFVQPSKETWQAETRNTPKQHRYRFWLTCFTIILGLPLLIYYVYCWGWWGQGSLLLQYLFQCNCSSASEEARYPDEVDVIVPACDYVSSMLSPSGRLLSVREEDSGRMLLDLQAGEKTPFLLPENGRFYFLTDNLLYVSLSYEENYILDHTTGDQYPIQRFSSLRPDAYEGGHANPTLLAEALRQAKYIFFRDDGTIVALDPEFPTSAEKNFITGWFDLPVRDSMQVEQFLKENNIVYQTILPDFPAEVVSPDGRFIARPDGIYLVETEERVVVGYAASRSYRPYSGKFFSARGWTYDGGGVIYSDFLNPCLIEASLFIFDNPRCYYEVPQPIVLLKIPEEYLLPIETP